MTRSLVASIRNRQEHGLMPVLSEIKVRSPKEGDLLRGRAPESLAGVMAGCPIAGLSVVTEPRDFGGDVDIVRRVRPLVDVPILRKDFIRTESDLDVTVAAGADVLLVTVNMVEDGLLARIHAGARERGLETLVEVHDGDDLRRLESLEIRPDLIGINNRDIRVGEVDDGDVSVTEDLAAAVHDRGWTGTPLLSESAITGPDDAVRARKAGADAILVGTSILRAADPAEMIRSLVAVGWPSR